MFKFIILIFFLLNLGHLFAQDNLLVNFSAQHIDNYIHLIFTVRGGVTCLGTQIHRAQDSVHFATIGSIPGVCGSNSSDETYTFDDVLPVKNQNNFYRINFGQLGNSQAIKLKYVDYGNGFVVAPNPAAGTLSIFFSNFNNQKLTFSLFNIQGDLLQSVATQGNKVIIGGNFLSSGIYFLQVRDEQTILYTNKIIFQ